MMEYAIGYVIGQFLSFLTDVRILGVSIICAIAFPRFPVSVFIGGLIGASISFWSAMEMAPMLNIPDPSVWTFVIYALNAALVTAIFASIRALLSKRQKAGDA